MRLVQHFSKALIQPYAMQITSLSSENLVSFHEFFQFRKNQKSLGARSPTVSAICVRIAWQMAGYKTRNNNSSTTVSQLLRNAGLSVCHLRVSMLKSEKIWCAYLIVNCVSLRTFWTSLVHMISSAPAKLKDITSAFSTLWQFLAVWQLKLNWNELLDLLSGAAKYELNKVIW